MFWESGKDYDLSKFDNKDGEITIVTYEGLIISVFRKYYPKFGFKIFYISESELKV
jgi:hypothetical protein